MKNFKTSKTIIRRFKLSDITQIHENFKNKKNISELLKSFEYLDNSKGFEVCRAVLKSYIKEFDSNEPIWAIVNKSNKKLIGYIKVTNYSEKNKRCNIDCGMSDEYWDNQCLKDAINMVLDFVFNKMGVELVECSYYNSNDRLENILENVGMTKEAVLRNRKYDLENDSYSDYIIFSMLKSEFGTNNNYFKLENSVIKFKKDVVKIAKNKENKKMYSICA